MTDSQANAPDESSVDAIRQYLEASCPSLRVDVVEDRSGGRHRFTLLDGRGPAHSRILEVTWDAFSTRGAQGIVGSLRWHPSFERLRREAGTLLRVPADGGLLTVRRHEQALEADRASSEAPVLTAPWILGGTIVTLCTLAAQSSVFLWRGDWPSLSALHPLRWIGVQWASSPGSWFGLYTVLDRTPLAFALITVTGLGTVILLSIDAALRRQRQ